MLGGAAGRHEAPLRRDLRARAGSLPDKCAPPPRPLRRAVGRALRAAAESARWVAGGRHWLNYSQTLSADKKAALAVLARGLPHCPTVDMWKARARAARAARGPKTGS